jgi:peptidyl-prolyl cis-trans isomerase B (cyclophilin B)
MRLRMLVVASLVILTLISGCSQKEETPVTETTSQETAHSSATLAGDAAAKANAIIIQMVTDKGDITLQLDRSAAPKTVDAFVKLVKSGFYDGMPFHRVEPGFVIQAGEGALAGKAPVAETIPDERSPIKHTRGVIAMARIYKSGQMVPNSASSQFYLCLGDAPHLDQLGFTAFGRVTKGLEVIDKIQLGDKIKKATVIE